MWCGAEASRGAADDTSQPKYSMAACFSRCCLSDSAGLRCPEKKWLGPQSVQSQTGHTTELLEVHRTPFREPLETDGEVEKVSRGGIAFAGEGIECRRRAVGMSGFARRHTRLPRASLTASTSSRRSLVEIGEL